VTDAERCIRQGDLMSIVIIAGLSRSANVNAPEVLLGGISYLGGCAQLVGECRQVVVACRSQNLRGSRETVFVGSIKLSAEPYVGYVAVAENRLQNLNPRTGSKNDYFGICQSEETHKIPRLGRQGTAADMRQTSRSARSKSGVY
jgi:hypothetical protein